MNHIRRILAAVATLAGAVLATATTTVAHASLPPLPPGIDKHPPLPVQTHTVVAGGMPGWQIALIAAGAALVGAAIAVLADRSWAARKAHATTA
jgi:hypothetical protein